MATTITFSDKPERRPSHGPCPSCGFLAELDSLGYVGAHLQIRVRRGKHGGPEEYRTTVRCDGEGLAPEQVA